MEKPRTLWYNNKICRQFCYVTVPAELLWSGSIYEKKNSLGADSDGGPWK